MLKKYPISDIHSFSSVDYRDSDDCKSNSIWWFRFKLLLNCFHHCFSHWSSPCASPWWLPGGFPSLTELPKTMQTPFDPAMMFLELLHKQMFLLSGTWRITHQVTKALTIIEGTLFEILAENPTLGLFASMEQDPDNGNQPIHWFYPICCGL